MTKSTSERFWRWLHDLSKRQIIKCVGGLQLLCPNCEQWSSIVGLEFPQGRIRDGKDYHQYKCGGCQKRTWWRMHGPFAESVPDNEVPV